jgi:DNA invertase Pin-like site-specific DNA recombinase
MDRGQDPEMQLREMQEYCDRRKWKVEIFADPGWSGAKLNRPELDRMMQACRRRKFDVVVVYRFDRFARSTKHLVDALAEFNSLGIQFVSLHENVDTTSPQGKLLFHIFAAIAEFERELIRERILSGIAHARSKGRKLGRPRRNPDVARIASLRAQGVPWEAIAAEMGISRATAIRAFLASQKLVTNRVQ